MTSITTLLNFQSHCEFVLGSSIVYRLISFFLNPLQLTVYNRMLCADIIQVELLEHLTDIAPPPPAEFSIKAQLPLRCTEPPSTSIAPPRSPPLTPKSIITQKMTNYQKQAISTTPVTQEKYVPIDLECLLSVVDQNSSRH